MPNDPFAGNDAHQAAAWVLVPAATAFRQLCDASFVGGWALGCMGLAPTDRPGIYEGKSLFDGSLARVRIVPHEAAGLIDYHVGQGEALRPRIMIRVVDGPAIGGREGSALVVLAAWRAPGTSPEVWTRTCTSHETEILLIKAQLETLAANGQA